MAKIYLYTVIFSGLMALLSFMGIPTGSGIILQTFLLTNPQLWSTAGFIAEFSAILTLAAAAGIVASFFIKQQTESILSISLVVILISFIADFASIVVTANAAFADMEWLGNIITLVFFPLIAGYCISLVQWWRGNDV